MPESIFLVNNLFNLFILHSLNHVHFSRTYSGLNFVSMWWMTTYSLNQCVLFPAPFSPPDPTTQIKFPMKWCHLMLFCNIIVSTSDEVKDACGTHGTCPGWRLLWLACQSRQVIISTVGALYFTPPGDPSIPSTYNTTVPLSSLTCYYNLTTYLIWFHHYDK